MWQLHHFDSVSSTMHIAERLARFGKGSGNWVVANQQTAGRGRHQRQFISHRHAGLWCTGLVTVPLQLPNPLSALSLVAGLSLLQAVQQVIIAQHRRYLPLSIKWPNDLLLQGKKLAGVLLLHWPQSQCVGIGFGVNVCRWPSFAADAQAMRAQKRMAPATLADYQCHIPALLLWQHLAAQLHHDVGLFFAQGFAPFAPTYELRHSLHQQWIEMKRIAGEQQVHGKVVGVGLDGSLCLAIGEDFSQTIAISSGEVQSLRIQESPHD